MSEVTKLRTVADETREDVIELLEVALGGAKRGRILAVTLTPQLKGRESVAVAHAGEVDVGAHVYALERTKFALLSGTPLTYSEEF